MSAKVPKRLGVVIGEFHDQLMNDCLEDARLAAVSMGAEITQVLAIPTAPRESDFQVAKGALVLYSTRLASSLTEGRINCSQVVWVPGTYEAALPMRTMLAHEAIDAVVIVGYIEKGSTLHGQEMGSTMSLLFKQMELDFGKPVGMGIIGPGATAEQAASRVAYAGARVPSCCSYRAHFQRRWADAAGAYHGGVRRQRDPRDDSHVPLHGQREGVHQLRRRLRHGPVVVYLQSPFGMHLEKAGAPSFARRW